MWNEIFGTINDDLLNGTDGNDSISGDSGNDSISGDLGNDVLYGGQGRDTLNGSDGDDILVGGLDGDQLTGGNGRDRFVYDSFSERTDTITDFNSLEDSIVLTNVFAEINYAGNNPIADSYLRFVQHGSNTRVEIDADGINGTLPFRTMAVLQAVEVGNLVVGSNVIIS